MSGEDIFVKGYNKTKTRLTINDRDASVDKNGAFNQRVALVRGKNRIVINSVKKN